MCKNISVKVDEKLLSTIAFVCGVFESAMMSSGNDHLIYDYKRSIISMTIEDYNHINDVVNIEIGQELFDELLCNKI